MGYSFFIGILLAVPLSILSNLLTPSVQRWWARTNDQRRKRRIEKLRSELSRLEAGERPKPPEPKARRPVSKEPRVIPLDATTRRLDERLTAFVVPFKNVEDRYQTTAHNVVATVTFAHFHGTTVQLKPASWLYSLPVANPRAIYALAATFGMSETRDLILFAYTNHTIIPAEMPHEYFTCRVDDPYRVEPLDVLELGEWTIVIHLDGDNFSGTFEYTLKLTPDSGMSWIPHDTV